MKNAIVVGGARGLGLYLVHKFIKNEYNVIVLDNDEQNIKKNLTNLKQVDSYICDIRNESNVVDTFAKVEAKWKTIDLLVYNAGYASANKITNFSSEQFNKCYEINLFGYFLASRETSKIMIKNNTRGVIIQINSKSGKVGSKYNSGYSAAKFGGVGLTQSMALDLAEHNIRVISLMLGNLLDSEMFESLIPAYAKKLNIKEDEVKQYYIDKVPLRRGCQFSDVANVLLFYASEKASYCTGQSINITGGQVMF